MISGAIHWYFKQRHHELWNGLTKAVDKQEEILLNDIIKLSETEYGKRYGIKANHTYKEFSNQVPIVQYDDLKPFIERTMLGEQQLLWPNDITWFAKSSGTTSNESKFIPISYESLEYTHYMGSRESLTQYLSFYPESEIFEGKGLLIGGSQRVNNLNQKSYVGDLSAILMNHMPLWANWKSTPDVQIAMMDNWEEKVEVIADSTLLENVTSISGVPTWTMILLEKILEKTGKSSILDIWPKLELFIHGGMNFEPYKSTFERLIPSTKMKYLETYNASEGFFGIQASKDSSDLVLLTHHGTFYEFYPIHKGTEYAVPLSEVEVGINYGVIITTNCGLWRYIIGDTIIFTSKNPFTFKISGRTKLFINAFGEELVIENSDTAIAKSCKIHEATIADYTACPIFERGFEGHEWAIEFINPPLDIEEFMETLDSELQLANSDYCNKRKSNLLMKFPKYTILKSGTFYKWMASKGKLGGQHKVPRLSNERQILEEVLSIQNL